ncbi:Ankyrin repeat [Musa troglodytarum]|uniref:Ankyrin repeat n=1 Tax=Musa troglodytarum TaxID=320322 RepID=A0A9E7FGF0_9LILI|nr:Ankyrin repeat [Musa troglodytarum]
MLPPCAHLLSLNISLPFVTSPSRYPRSSSHSRPVTLPFCSPFPALKPFPPAAASSFPYSYQNPDRDQQQDPQLPVPQDEELVIGDCLVFEDGAFEDGDPFDPPSPSDEAGRPGRRRPAAAASTAETESLVPNKWKEAVEEINMTKKEKRRISHELKFGSRMERRKKPPVPDMEEYRTYREMKLAQLKPVVIDDPREFPQAAVPPEHKGLPGGRVAPRNPRLGLDVGTLEDIREFFNSGKFVPRDVDDDKNPRGRRKLFTPEEKSKWLPLHGLAASGEFFLLDTLLKHNVDINGVDKDGLSAMHKAILCKKQAIINYLLRNSANPFIRDKDGATLMHYAVQTASSQTIKILLLYSVDINLADDDGWTPLHLAVQTQRTDIVRLLLIKGADKTIRNHDGLTPLDLCLFSGHNSRTYEVIKLLKQVTPAK